MRLDNSLKNRNVQLSGVTGPGDSAEMTELKSQGRGGARVGLAVASALLLSACVNPAFRQSVGEYGALTRAAAAQQNARVAAIAADEAERIRADLAARRVDLRLKPDCAARLLTDPASGPAAVCSLVEVGGKPIEQAPGFANIVALTDALSDYADQLIALAADSTQDREAFAQSVTGLGSAVGALDGAVRSATGSAAGHDAPRIEAVAAVLAEAGSLYLAQRRAAALKRIVIAADPIVQSATGLLSGADDRVQLYYRAELAGALLKAQDHASAVAHDPGSSVADVRAAQDALFAQLAAYNGQGADTLRFRAIGEAHAKLAQAARAGASAAELEAAIAAIVDLAGTAGAAVKALKDQPAGQNTGEHGHGR